MAVLFSRSISTLSDFLAIISPHAFRIETELLRSLQKAVGSAQKPVREPQWGRHRQAGNISLFFLVRSP